MFPNYIFAPKTNSSCPIQRAQSAFSKVGGNNNPHVSGGYRSASNLKEKVESANLKADIQRSIMEYALLQKMFRKPPKSKPTRKSKPKMTKSMMIDPGEQYPRKEVNFRCTDKINSKRSFMEVINEENEDEVEEQSATNNENNNSEDLPSKKIQESCADFLSIVHDNVLDTVKNTVEDMLKKYFECTIFKLESVSSQLVRNECVLSKMYMDILEKIKQDTDFNTQQFNYITQQLIKTKNSDRAHSQNRHEHTHHSVKQSSRIASGQCSYRRNPYITSSNCYCCYTMHNDSNSNNKNCSNNNSNGNNSNSNNNNNNSNYNNNDFNINGTRNYNQTDEKDDDTQIETELNTRFNRNYSHMTATPRKPPNTDCSPIHSNCNNNSNSNSICDYHSKVNRHSNSHNSNNNNSNASNMNRNQSFEQTCKGAGTSGNCFCHSKLQNNYSMANIKRLVDKRLQAAISNASLTKSKINQAAMTTNRFVLTAPTSTPCPSMIQLNKLRHVSNPATDSRLIDLRHSQLNGKSTKRKHRSCKHGKASDLSAYS